MSKESLNKESIRKVSGVLAAVGAQTGKLTKEEAKELSGLNDSEFAEVYNRASRIMGKLEKIEGDKMDHFLEHYTKEIEDYVKETTHYFYLT